MAWVVEDLKQLAADPIIAQLWQRASTPPLRPRMANLTTLISLIIEQQIAVKAARTIMGRINSVLGDEWELAACLTLDENAWRSFGISGVKTRYIQNLLQHVVAGNLQITALPKMSDAEIVQHLTQIKGIGRWTAEYYLLFCLQRRDVWPAGDLVLQASLQNVYGLNTRPNAKQTDVIGQSFAPYRSAATLLFWHAYKTPSMLLL